jgi:hypothetical protein
MSTIKIRFADEIEALGGKVERAVEDMFRSFSPVFNLAERSWKPLMDMYETPGQIIVLAEVAGVDKDDLEVEISPRAVRSHLPAGRDPVREVRAHSFFAGPDRPGSRVGVLRQRHAGNPFGTAADG